MGASGQLPIPATPCFLRDGSSYLIVAHMTCCYPICDPPSQGCKVKPKAVVLGGVIKTASTQGRVIVSPPFPPRSPRTSNPLTTLLHKTSPVPSSYCYCQNFQGPVRALLLTVQCAYDRHLTALLSPKQNSVLLHVYLLLGGTLWRSTVVCRTSIGPHCLAPPPTQSCAIRLATYVPQWPPDPILVDSACNLCTTMDKLQPPVSLDLSLPVSLFPLFLLGIYRIAPSPTLFLS